MRSIIVHGPQACGKTRNAQLLAAAFGCRKIVDDWDGRDPIPANTLALTNTEPPFATDSKVMSFVEACRLAGIKVS